MDVKTDEMVGRRFGFLTVTKKRGRVKGTSHYKVRVVCDCGSPTCGKVGEVRVDHLKSGATKSCGQLYRYKKIRGPRKHKVGIVAGARWAQTKVSAKKRGIEFSLSSEEYWDIARLPCHYCGGEPVEVKANTGMTGTKRALTAYMNGVDRVDNSKGYEVNNLVPCCKFCNVAKNDSSLEDFLSQVQKIADHQAKKKNAEKS